MLEQTHIVVRAKKKKLSTGNLHIPSIISKLSALNPQTLSCRSGSRSTLSSISKRIPEVTNKNIQEIKKSIKNWRNCKKKNVFLNLYFCYSSSVFTLAKGYTLYFRLFTSRGEFLVNQTPGMKPVLLY